MTVDITSTEAGANILRHVSECTLKQGVWHEEGKEIACLLGAIHSGINHPQDCPASVMPLWLAECTVTLFDGLAKSDIYPIAERYGKLVVTGAMARADDRVRRRWLIRVILDARASAAPVSDKLAVWPQVVAAGDQVIAALQGDGNLTAAAACVAAWAAEAAAAAWAAEATTAAETAAAVWAAARAVAAVAAAAWAAKAATVTETAVTAAAVAMAAARATAAAETAAAVAAATFKRLFIELLDEIEKGAV